MMSNIFVHMLYQEQDIFLSAAFVCNIYHFLEEALTFALKEKGTSIFYTMLSVLRSIWIFIYNM